MSYMDVSAFYCIYMELRLIYIIQKGDQQLDGRQK